MTAYLLALILLATPISPTGGGYHKGWRNKKAPPPPPPPAVEQVGQPHLSGGNQGGSGSEDPGSHHYAD